MTAWRAFKRTGSAVRTSRHYAGLHRGP